MKQESSESVKVEREDGSQLSLPPKRGRSPGRRSYGKPPNNRIKRESTSYPFNERSPSVKRQRVKLEDEDITLVGDLLDDEDSDERVKEV